MSLPLSHAGGSVDGISAALDLRFASSLSLTSTSGITPSFSRASTGTYFNASGVLTTAAVNAPRFNHVYNGSSWVSKGLLIEEQRTNSLIQSGDISNAAYTKSFLTAPVSAVLSPDNATYSNALTEDTTTNLHRFYRNTTTTAGKTVTASVFLKAGTARYAVICHSDNIDFRSYCVADLQTGTITNSGVVFAATGAGYIGSTISNCGNGWYRVSLTGTNLNTDGNYYTQVGISNSSTSTGFPSYLGSGKILYAFGIQLEFDSSFPTSYIPTTTTQLTRSADVCQITGGDFSGLWNLSAGTIVVDGDSAVGPSVTGGAYEFWSIHGTPTIEYYYRASDGSVVVDNVVRKTVIAIPAANTRLNTAIAFTASDFAASVNGASVTTSANLTMPVTPTVFGVGNYSTVGGFQVNGHIARLRYFNTRLSNNRLVELSSTTKLQVDIDSAAAKGIVVKGYTSQTANLQEWQNSAGTALASVDSSGRLTIASSATASNADLYINNSSSVNPVIKWNAVSGLPGLRFYSGSTLIGAFQDNGAVRGSSFGTWGGMNFGDFYVQRGSAGIVSFGETAGAEAISVGCGNASYFGHTLLVNTSYAATKGIVVKGVASQTANLTEWQDSTGAVVAAVSPNGAFTGSSFTPYGTFNSTTTIFGNNYWTPNYTGGVTSPSAGTYTKSTGNANVWDGQAYSSEGYTKNVYCAARASQTNGYIMFGLNSDPATDGNYSSLDYAWFFRTDGILQIYESGGAGSTYGAYTTSTVLSITYDGSNVQYWKDGVIQRTVARSTGNPLYFDTSFYTLSSSLNSVQFGPIGQPFGISGTSGYLPKFTSQQTLGNSIVYDNGTNVGIGTASPSFKLQVDAASVDANIVANVTSGYGGIGVYAAGTSKVILGYVGANANYGSQTVTGDIALKTNNSNLHINTGSGNSVTTAYFSSAGNVGIGTASPSYRLQVSGQTYLGNGASNPLYIDQTVADGVVRDSVYLYEASAQGTGRQAISWYNGNQGYYKARIYTEPGPGYAATRFYIDTADNARTVATRLCIHDGNVGINTTSPGAKLQVDTGATGTKGQIIKAVASQTANLSEWQNNSGTALSYVASNGDIYSTTSFVHYSSGNSGYYLKRPSDNATVASLTWSPGSVETNLYALTFLNLDASGSGIRMGGWTTWADSVNAQVMWLKNSNIIWGNNALGVTGRTAFNTSAFQITAGSYATIPAPTSRFEVYGDSQFLSQSTSAKTVVVKAAASQTANLTEWQNNGGTAIAYMDANGNFAAVTKSFLIDHPTPAKAAEGKKLRYASLEGPENGVYYRGRLEGESEIVLPDYWRDLVDPDSITVSLTARKFAQPSLFVVDANAEKVIVESDREINCDFVVFATRRDIAKLEVEPDGE